MVGDRKPGRLSGHAWWQSRIRKIDSLWIEAYSQLRWNSTSYPNLDLVADEGSGSVQIKLTHYQAAIMDLVLWSALNMAAAITATERLFLIIQFDLGFAQSSRAPN
jgi:hypothetical protein